MIIKQNKYNSNINIVHDYSLDYIRVFAMIAVILVHITIYLPIPNSLKGLFIWGAHGVQIFFVLSGYLAIASLYNKKYDKKTYIIIIKKEH